MKMADMVSTSRFDDAYAEKATRQLMNGDPKVFQMAMRIPTSEVQYMQRLLRKNNLSGPLQPHGSACGSETTSGDSGDTDDSGDAISPEEELSMRTQLAHMRRVNKICHGCQSKDNVAEMRRCSRCQLVWYCGRECQKSDWTLRHREWCCNPAAALDDLPFLPVLIRLPNDRQKGVAKKAPSMTLKPVPVSRRKKQTSV